MTDKEKIKQEIERLKHTSNAYDRSRFMLLLEIEEFINSLPKESAIEDLEEAAKQHSKRTFNGILIEDNIDAFKSGAEWQKQKDEIISGDCLIELENDFDWQSFRNQAANEILCSMIQGGYGQDRIIHQSELAVKYADELIKHLKEKEA